MAHKRARKNRKMIWNFRFGSLLVAGPRIERSVHGKYKPGPLLETLSANKINAYVRIGFSVSSF